MSRTRRQAFAASLLLAGATLLVFHQWLFDGEVLYWGDMGLYFLPMTRFLRSQLSQGVLPLWNPMIFGGVPFVGNPQVWPLYPATVLLALLPASQFLTVSCVLHVFLAGLFMCLWLTRGRMALPLWPAMLGAVGYMFGGYLVAKAQYPNMLQALAYVPLILWRVEALLACPTPQSTVWLGVALGLQLLAAHAQVTLYTLYFGVLYGLLCLAFAPERRVAAVLGSTVAAGALALALSCGQWLPTLAAQRLAHRQALPLADVDRLHLSVTELTNLIQPWRFGSPLRGDFTGPGAFWETACYTGALTLVLALLFLVTRLPRTAPGRIEALFWLLVAVGSVWLALGSRGGLFRVAYGVVPGFRLFHDPARLLLGAAVALPVLAAQGLAVLQDRLPARPFAFAGAAVVLLTVLDLGRFDNGIYPLLPAGQWENLTAQSPVASALRRDRVIATGTGRLLTVDDFSADDAFVDWSDFRPPPHYAARIANTGLPNLPMAMDISTAGGYEPLALRDTGTLALLARELVSSQTDPRLQTRIAPLLGTMSIRDVLPFRPQPLRMPPGFTSVPSWQEETDRGTVWQNDRFQPRARLYTDWQREPALTSPDDVALGWLSDPQIAARPWLDVGASPPTASSTPPDAVPIEEDTPDRVTLSVPPRPAPVVCMLADTDFPGWRATLESQPVPLLRADGVYRAVLCPASSQTRRIAFQFRPEAFVLGLYVTGLAVLFLAASGTASLIRRLNS